jgi:hypothetical protein
MNARSETGACNDGDTFFKSIGEYSSVTSVRDSNYFIDGGALYQRFSVALSGAIPCDDKSIKM